MLWFALDPSGTSDQVEPVEDRPPFRNRRLQESWTEYIGVLLGRLLGLLPVVPSCQVSILTIRKVAFCHHDEDEGRR